MTPHALAEADSAVALKTYAEELGERKNVLIELARTSREMRSMLERDSSTDIKDILERRELECRRYGDLCSCQTVSDDVLFQRAQNAARSGERECVAQAMAILALFEDAQELANEIMTCQVECETMLRNRLQSTAKALKQSAQRRKLDAVYGPAHRHDVPVFMDKQR